MDTALLEPIPLEHAARLPVEVAGGKASRLATLRARGFMVPDGFVLTTAVHDRATRTVGAERTRTVPTFPEQLRASFVAACDRLGYPLIVRSSAVAEDLAAASFAGQFESVLHVRTADDAIAAVERCWHAASSEHLTDYRRAHGTADGSVALLVQRQLAPGSAGVAFGRDPVTGDDRVVIEAVPGLADRLLEGEVSPERWTVVDGMAARDASGSGAPALREPEVLRIAAMVQRLGEVFDGPQDVEWAFVGDELNVLQSRPITTLAASAVSGSRARPSVPAAWLRDSTHWPDRLSPFGAAVWANMMRNGTRHAADVFGLVIATGELHVVEHRAYLEVIPFGAGKLPPPPPWLLPVLLRIVPPIRRRIARAVEAVRTDVAGDVLERWIYADAPRLAAELETLRAVDPAVMDVLAVVDHLDETLGFLERACTEHWVVEFAQSQVLGDYVFLARDLLNWDPGHALSALNARSSTSTDAAVALDELAKVFVAAPEEAAGSPGSRVTATLADDTEASAALHRYLDRYGGRMLGADPMDRMLAEQPESLEPALDAAIARLRAASTLDEPARGSDSGVASDPPDPASQDVPDRERARWQRAVARAERYYGIRDESELLGFGEPLGLVRRATLELGRRLADRGLLERPDDCFMLTPGELREAAGGESRLLHVASTRRREFDAAALLPDVSAVGTLPPQPDLRALPVEARFANEAFIWYLGSIVGEARDAPEGALVAGTAASAGRYRGPVRVIRGSQDFHRVRQGDVLVCPTTAPSWSPILGQVGAVVADHGGMLSHPAIIAREFGIPAIVGTTDGTSRLRDGEVVLVDGAAGIVSR
ncbi:PEP/pyruvate-binding domain-containing protein [Agromyces sp. NPDC058484]|uniref:PEP/pyruvate-binding domain-containing protein n=1 Tax=Agromyces sp. NPDC058484 TaxID=3346524 RepID=UPI0036487BDA